MARARRSPAVRVARKGLESAPNGNSPETVDLQAKQRFSAALCAATRRMLDGLGTLMHKAAQAVDEYEKRLLTAEATRAGGAKPSGTAAMTGPAREASPPQPSRRSTKAKPKATKRSTKSTARSSRTKRTGGKK